MTAVFSVSGLAGGSELPGPWSTSSPDAVSFGVPSAEEEIMVWSLSLPADPDQARQALEKVSAALGDIQGALDQSESIMAGPGPEDDAPVSFGQGSGNDGPIDRLWRDLAGDSVSFNLGDRAGATINQARDLGRQVAQLAQAYQRVETSVEDRILARTLVFRSGHLQTLWRPRLTGEEMDLHHKGLTLALESRRALLSMLARTLGTSAGLAMRFALPGGTVTALPLVWRTFKELAGKRP